MRALEAHRDLTSKDVRHATFGFGRPSHDGNPQTPRGAPRSSVQRGPNSSVLPPHRRVDPSHEEATRAWGDIRVTRPPSSPRPCRYLPYEAFCPSPGFSSGSPSLHADVYCTDDLSPIHLLSLYNHTAHERTILRFAMLLTVHSSHPPSPL